MRNGFYVITFLLVLNLSCFSQSWQYSGNSPSVPVKCMASIGSTLFMGSTVGGVYKSSDLGQTWVACNGGGSVNHVQSLASDGSNLYAGTGGFSATTIYKSSDLGQTWTIITPTGMSPNSDVTAMVSDGSYLYAATSNGTVGVYKSPLVNLSSGSWTAFDAGLPTKDVKTLSVCGNTLFANTYVPFDASNGIYKSSISSANWISTSSGITPVSNSIRAFAIQSSFMLAADLFNNPHLYASTDGGLTWANPAGTAFNSSVTVYALHISGSSIYAGTESGGVFVSTDQGATWSGMNNGLTGTCGMNVRSLSQIGSVLFAGSDCGVYRSVICTSVPATPSLSMPGNSLSICAGESVSLSATGNGSIYWYTQPVGGNPVANGSQIVTIPIFQSGYFYAEAYGCAPSASRVAVQVVVTPGPTIALSQSKVLTCQSAAVDLVASGAGTYTWQPGGLTGQTVTVFPTMSTNYTATGTDANGCRDTASIMHLVIVCNALQESSEQAAAWLQVFPNPTKTSLTLRSDYATELKILNQLGSCVKTLSLKEGRDQTILDLELPAGLYLLQATGPQGVFSTRLIVEP